MSRQDADGAFACIATDALPGTSNDSKPMGGRKIPIMQQGADAYVTAIHTWILLLDATQPRTFEPTPGRRPSRTSTPR